MLPTESGVSGDAPRGARSFNGNARRVTAWEIRGTTWGRIWPRSASRADEILTAILDPNREVGPNFMQFAVALHDGRVLTGMIAEESPSA